MLVRKTDEVYIPKNFVRLGRKENSFSGHEAFPLGVVSMFFFRAIVPDLCGCGSHSNEIGKSIFLFIVYCLFMKINFFSLLAWMRL